MTAFDNQMTFETVEDRVIQQLNRHAADNNYNVLGYQQTSKSAEKANVRREVNAYYKSGSFNPASSTTNSSKQHQMTFHVEMTVSVEAEDTDTEFISAQNRANKEINDFIRRVWNALMQGDFVFLDPNRGANPAPTDLNSVTGKQIPNIEKSDPYKDSGYVIINAQLDLVMMGSENPDSIGDPTGLDAESNNTELIIFGENTGVSGVDNILDN